MPWQAELPFAIEKPAPDDGTSRAVALGDRIVPYVLRRARRRTIGLTIDHRGLRVGAPRRASLSEIEALILKHGEWVAKKLDEWRNRRPPAPREIVDGVRLPYLGELLEIRISDGNNRARWDEAVTSTPTLTLCLRSPAHAERVLENALREKARQCFLPRLAHYAGQISVAVPPLSLSAARTRWGSCSLKTGIRLNWRLIHCAPRLIDYVVVHELAHLREMNHGPRFWALVGKHYPDYRTARDELKKLSP